MDMKSGMDLIREKAERAGVDVSNLHRLHSSELATALGFPLEVKCKECGYAIPFKVASVEPDGLYCESCLWGY